MTTIDKGAVTAFENYKSPNGIVIQKSDSNLSDSGITVDISTINALEECNGGTKVSQN